MKFHFKKYVPICPCVREKLNNHRPIFMFTFTNEQSYLKGKFICM